MTDSLAMLLVRRAMIGAELLPIDERADLYQAAAEALAVRHPDESRLASATANQLREVSAMQLTFTAALNGGATH